jgi:hypothetical protein
LQLQEIRIEKSNQKDSKFEQLQLQEIRIENQSQKRLFRFLEFPEF